MKEFPERLYFYSFSYQEAVGQPQTNCSGTYISTLGAEYVLNKLIEDFVPVDKRHTVTFLSFNVLPE